MPVKGLMTLKLHYVCLHQPHMFECMCCC